MKITIYELLGLIKDGKAPKTITKIVGNRIKYDKFLFYDEECKNYYDLDGNHPLFTDEIVSDLNDEIEIIEEPKKIEKIKSLNNVGNCQNLTEFEDKQQLNNHILKDKINEIIDKLNEGDK